MKKISTADLARHLDSTILYATAKIAEIERLLDDAIESGTQICINESRISVVQKKIRTLRTGHIPLVSAVIGFPLGACTTKIKNYSARHVLDLGVNEIDMVANIGFLKDNYIDCYKKDIATVAEEIATVNASGIQPRVLKVIIENCYLTEDEKRTATEIVTELSREFQIPVFVKTSTGFGTPGDGIPVGATLEDVKLMRKAAKAYCSHTNTVGIKAAGGVKSAADAINMLEASGAFFEDDELHSDSHLIARIGTSSAAKILADL